MFASWFVQSGTTTWLIAAAVVAVLLIGGYFVWRLTKRKESRYSTLLQVASEHPQSILLCMRCASDDAVYVSRRLAAAVNNATSPLRLRFAVVQELGEHGGADVFDLLTSQLKHADVGHPTYFVDKIKTYNVAATGFLAAVEAYKHLYGGERVVAVLDARVELLQNWDVELCECVASVSTNTAVTAPAPLSFPVFSYVATGPNTFWPIVAPQPFTLPPKLDDQFDEMVPVLAASHIFTAFHGSYFSSLPSLPPQHHTPLLFADVVWSSWLYDSYCSSTRQGYYGSSRGSSTGTSGRSSVSHAAFAALPFALFSVDAHYTSPRFGWQKPEAWNYRLNVSSAFAAFAGINFEEQRQQDQKKQEFQQEQGSSNNNDTVGTSPPGPPVTSTALLLRAVLGLTHSAWTHARTASRWQAAPALAPATRGGEEGNSHDRLLLLPEAVECTNKYGTLQEIERRIASLV
jgi:hypothetical protein